MWLHVYIIEDVFSTIYIIKEKKEKHCDYILDKVTNHEYVTLLTLSTTHNLIYK